MCVIFVHNNDFYVEPERALPSPRFLCLAIRGALESEDQGVTQTFEGKCYLTYPYQKYYDDEEITFHDMMNKNRLHSTVYSGRIIQTTLILAIILNHYLRILYN